MIDRTTLLLGEDGKEKLRNSKVIVFGLGGVGGYCVEALARSGVGSLTLVDHDVISRSNFNRQIYALYSTLGQKKVYVARQRIAEINPDCKVIPMDMFYNASCNDALMLTQYDYIVDAIDSLESKVALIKTATESAIPIISSMGTANRLTASFSVKDIYETENDPLARVLRQRLRKEGVSSLKVVCSDYLPDKNCVNPLSSICHVVGTAGFLLAQTVIKNLII